MIFLTSGGNLGDDWGVNSNGVNLLESISMRENIIYLGGGGVLLNGDNILCKIKDFNGTITRDIWVSKREGAGYNVAG